MGRQRDAILQNLPPMQKWLNETAADGPWQAVQASTKIHCSPRTRSSTRHYSTPLSAARTTYRDSCSSSSDAAQPRDGG